jgi:hypothetical protein
MPSEATKNSLYKTMKNSSLPILLVVVVAFGLIMVLALSRPVQVIVKDSPLKFGSVRKHPFDVYADPYHPPERENPYWGGKSSSYEQVGLLQNESRAGFLPLFGRPSQTSSNKWEYYTMTDGLKIPVNYQSKPCNSDTGCPEANNNDLMDVFGLGKYKVNVYDVRQPRYNPRLL